jgi:hypothetical protein
LIRQIQQPREPSAAASAQAAQARLGPLTATYEFLARNLVRAAARTHRALLQQPRERVEEMLRAMLAQAAYESDRFRSQLAVEANNFWGMKDRPDVRADRIFYKGEYYERFPNMFEGCCGYFQCLKRPHYAGLERHLGDKRDFLDYLAKCGWCPKKTYADEAAEVYRADQAEIDRAARLAVEELIAAARRGLSPG